MTAEDNLSIRDLIYIPIIHTPEDMGTLSHSVQSVMLRDMSIKSWRHKIRFIAKVWDEIEQTIDNLDLSYEKVRLYQDGLPTCGREGEIVKELALKGSRNHCLLITLMNRGATLMGTESADLLTQEYLRVQQSVSRGDPRSRTKSIESKMDTDESLLDRRDRYIATRVNDTLVTGETGILFIGMLHKAQRYFDSDIKVIYPIRHLLDVGGK